MANITTYSIKATPKDGSEPYIIFNGKRFTDKEIAETECNACNKNGIKQFFYEVIEN